MIQVPAKAIELFFSTASRVALGLAQLPIQWAMGNLSTGIQVAKAWSRLLIKNVWSYNSTPPYAFVASTETTSSFTCCKNYSYTVLYQPYTTIANTNVSQQRFLYGK